MIRRFIFIWLVGICVILLVGCFKIEQEIDLSQGTVAASTTRLWVSEVYAGGEMDVFLDTLRLTVPAIDKGAF